MPTQSAPLTAANVFDRGTVTVTGLAKEYGIGNRLAWELMNAGKLPFSQLKPGGKRFIPRAAVDALLREGLVGMDEI